MVLVSGAHFLEGQDMGIKSFWIVVFINLILWSILSILEHPHISAGWFIEISLRPIWVYPFMVINHFKSFFMGVLQSLSNWTFNIISTCWSFQLNHAFSVWLRCWEIRIIFRNWFGFIAMKFLAIEVGDRTIKIVLSWVFFNLRMIKLIVAYRGVRHIICGLIPMSWDFTAFMFCRCLDPKILFLRRTGIDRLLRGFSFLIIFQYLIRDVLAHFGVHCDLGESIFELLLHIEEIVLWSKINFKMQKSKLSLNLELELFQEFVQLDEVLAVLSGVYAPVVDSFLVCLLWVFIDAFEESILSIYLLP